MSIFKRKEKLDEILDKIYNKHKIRRYFTLFIGCLLAATAFNLFFLPHSIVYGGVSGISIVVNNYPIDNLPLSIFAILGLPFPYFIDHSPHSLIF